ncbi:hypothetical protein HYH03_013764 [Edaphochlamys debaryana]|uniref:Uncharacterized protein n=1 Tax=Edaphochlamys debaryana TaxID=47281 RepID=A0A835XVI7_9CHLO|nr:hypothetical protein HYH03_013764 [Edaphochlamys debaryana]|eukprot:KAG2487625.1 hypothetical protein HYH03_013764 [Edaphochlamys debaryana]
MAFPRASLHQLGAQPQPQLQPQQSRKRTRQQDEEAADDTAGEEGAADAAAAVKREKKRGRRSIAMKKAAAAKRDAVAGGCYEVADPVSVPAPPELQASYHWRDDAQATADARAALEQPGDFYILLGGGAGRKAPLPPDGADPRAGQTVDLDGCKLQPFHPPCFEKKGIIYLPPSTPRPRGWYWYKLKVDKAKLLASLDDPSMYEHRWTFIEGAQRGTLRGQAFTGGPNNVGVAPDPGAPPPTQENWCAEYLLVAAAAAPGVPQPLHPHRALARTFNIRHSGAWTPFGKR